MKMNQRINLACVLGAFLLGGVVASNSVGQEPSPEQLRTAASEGRLDDVKKFIEAKVDVNVPSNYGVTALALACDHGHSDVAEALLDAGADPNTKDKFYGFTPLTWAVMRRNGKLVEVLVKRDIAGLDTSILQAIGSGNEEIVTLFLESKKLTPKGLADAYVLARRMKSEAMESKITPYLDDEAKAIAEKSELIATKTTTLEPFVGTYKTDDGPSIVFSTKDGELQYSEAKQDSSTSLKATEDKNVFACETDQATFERDGDTVKGVEIKKGNEVRKYSKVVVSDSDPTEAVANRLSLTPDFPFADTNWPNFRGVLSRGIAETASLPTTWNAGENKNIAWKTPIPGLATSSPVVWGNRVIVSTADQEGDQSGFRTGPYGDVESVKGEGICSYQVLCLERDTGKVLWQKECAKEIPKVKRHSKASHANPTPTTDGSVVVVSFAGAGVYCLDLESGNLVWKLDLGKLDSGWFYDKSYQWGFASSPYIFESTVILQCDHQEGAFVAAFDLKTGHEKWKTERDDIPTWSSPVAFVAEDGTPMVVVAGTKSCAGYNARTGKELWKLGGFSEIVVPTPQVTRDLILLTSGYRPITPIVTLSHSARGDLSLPKEKEVNSPFFWAVMRGGPYMPTPLIRKDRLYVLDNSGIVSCYKLESGQRLFRQRLRGDSAGAFTSSVVANGENLFCTNEEGTTFVVAFDDQGTIVSKNELGEAVLSTLAISGDMIFVRGEKHLFAIKAMEPSPAAKSE